MNASITDPLERCGADADMPKQDSHTRSEGTDNILDLNTPGKFVFGSEGEGRNGSAVPNLQALTNPADVELLPTLRYGADRTPTGEARTPSGWSNQPREHLRLNYRRRLRHIMDYWQ